MEISEKQKIKLENALKSPVETWVFTGKIDGEGRKCICGAKIKNRHEISNGETIAYVGSECIQYFSEELQRKVFQKKKDEKLKIPLTKKERELKKKMEEEELQKMKDWIAELAAHPRYNKGKGMDASTVAYFQTGGIKELRRKAAILQRTD